MKFASIDEALRRIRRGEMVLVADDEDRENEGDLTMAAEWVTPEAINFMLRWARGLVCMPTAPEYLDRLDVPPMVPPGTAGCDTAFSISIDHRRVRQRDRCRRPRPHRAPVPRPRGARRRLHPARSRLPAPRP